MKKSTLALLALLILASLGITLALRRGTQSRLQANEAALREQKAQLAGLVAERSALSNQLAQANRPAQPLADELARLRAQAAALQTQTGALARQLAASSPPPAAAAPDKTEPKPPEYFKKLHEVAGNKPRQALQLCESVMRYASDHQGAMPTAWDQVASYVADDQRGLLTTNRYDLVYHGSLNDLAGVPNGAVALFRDRTIWTAPSGKKARVYGMANGSSQIVESDDDFKAWEAKHIVPSAAPRR